MDTSPDVTHWTFQGLPCRQRMFCLNGGSCTYFPRLNIQACNCSVGFEGSRCEFVTNLLSESTSESRTNNVCSYESFLANDTGFRIFLIFTNIIIIILLCLLTAFVCRLRNGLERPSTSDDAPAARALCDLKVPNEAGIRCNAAGHPRKPTYVERVMSVLGIKSGDPREDYHALSSTARTSFDSGNGVSTYEESVPISQPASKWAIVRKKFIEPDEVDTENEMAD
ncbi:pro-neuregulin-1, membrane-bound isoform-like [Paramacrobiotus metropolitanus]|uniref:pro-neuregulin-1, membrane-bound isoform-like n=1 Tax=Paramacrobiotus metropolitanus TaxID=2943436 RepID=UPI002445B4FF|nr:pro-neuregulin-1, membrane-bound isoform-like [Paramacrobiotus metropolitanus]